MDLCHLAFSISLRCLILHIYQEVWLSRELRIRFYFCECDSF